MFQRESDTTKESASSSLTLNEYYGVPKATRLIVVESKELKTKVAEIKKQEENQEMENELNPEATVDAPIVTPAEPIVETPAEEPEAPIATPVADDSEPASEGDTPEQEPVVVQVEEVEAEIGAEPAEAESVGETAETLALRASNASLLAQVEGLTGEIKNLYIERIVEQSALTPEKQTALAEKLNTRSIDSLRDRLEDMKEGFVTAKEIPTEPAAQRTVTKVASPVPVVESVREPKDFTTENTVDFLKQLLKK